MKEHTTEIDWREKICEIVGDMLDHPGDLDIYPTAKCYAELEQLIAKALIYGVGWAHAEACAALDAGEDPREQELPKILHRAYVDLSIPRQKGN